MIKKRNKRIVLDSPYIEGDMVWFIVYGGMPRKGKVVGVKIKNSEIISFFLEFDKEEKEVKRGDVYGTQDEALLKVLRPIGGRVARELLLRKQKGIININSEEEDFLTNVIKSKGDRRRRVDRVKK